MATQRRSDIRDQVAYVLGHFGMMMVVLFAVQVLFSAIPLKFTDPNWILANSANLTNTAPVPIFGAALIMLAHQLDDKSVRLSKYLLRIQKLALPVALGFLLLIPLQFYAGYRQIRNAEKEALSTMSSLRKAEQRIQVADAPQLQQLVRNLPGGAQVQVNDANLEPLRASLLKDLQPRIKSLETTVADRKQKAIEASLKDRIFQSLLSLISASSFAALGSLGSRGNRGGLLKLLAGNPPRRRPDFSDEELLADEEI